MITKPAEGIDILGLVYHDHRDNEDNEDIFKLDHANGEIAPYKPNLFEREYPQYSGFHRGRKAFLRSAADQPEATADDEES